MPNDPNILVILSDEQHLQTVGAYGGLPVRTPHADRIASEGVRFDQAYCCASICSPSRAALFTGQLPHRFGTVENDLAIPAGTPNLAGLLRSAGYRIGYAGKWHVDRETLPSNHGFEGKDFPGYGFHARMFERECDPKAVQKKLNWYYEYLADKGLPVPELTDAEPAYQEERKRLILHGRQSGDAQSSIPGFVGAEAARLAESFSRRRKTDGSPFFLWMNFWGPHNPCHIPEPYFSMVDPKSIPEPPSFAETFAGKPAVHERMSKYWGMHGAPWEFWQEHLARYMGYCALIDDQVGRVLDTLEASGELDNTLVVYASDHGDMIGRHQLLDKGPFMYDDTYRIPLAIRGPGISPGNCDEFVYLHDLFPTILSWAGAEAPGHDGASLDPLLGGSGRWDSREAVFGEFDSQIYHYPQRMVRTRKHKFIFNSADICEFYDLERDPHEMRNEIENPEYAGAKEELKERLLAHLKATRDPIAGKLAAIGWSI